MSLFDLKTAKNQELTRADQYHYQSGSAIVLIFVVIAIFAALTFVISSGSRSGASNLSKEKADLVATEILDYAQSVKQAVQTLQINGCHDTEISFEANNNSGYFNPNSPSDNSCHIFHPNGGGINYNKPSTDINDGDDIIFTGSNSVDGVGSGCNAIECTDLILVYENVKSDICTTINKKLNVASSNNFQMQESNFFSISAFIGSYAYEARLSDSPDDILGNTAGCLEGNTAPQTSGTYYFYKVLIVR